MMEYLFSKVAGSPGFAKNDYHIFLFCELMQNTREQLLLNFSMSKS